jgi:hypothetical protein
MEKTGQKLLRVVILHRKSTAMATTTRPPKTYSRVWLYMHASQEKLLERAASLSPRGRETLSTWGRTQLNEIVDEEWDKLPRGESPIKSRRPNENYTVRRIIVLFREEHKRLKYVADAYNYTIGKWAMKHLLAVAKGTDWRDE